MSVVFPFSTREGGIEPEGENDSPVDVWYLGVSLPDPNQQLHPRDMVHHRQTGKYARDRDDQRRRRLLF